MATGAAVVVVLVVVTAEAPTGVLPTAVALAAALVEASVG